MRIASAATCSAEDGAAAPMVCHLEVLALRKFASEPEAFTGCKP